MLPLLGLLENLVEISDETYNMLVNFKNSEGWIVFPPMFIHRLAPQNSAPTTGMNTKTKSIALIINNIGAIFLIICRGSFKSIKKRTNPINTDMVWRKK